jgi:hypothetical protein
MLESKAADKLRSFVKEDIGDVLPIIAELVVSTPSTYRLSLILKPRYDNRRSPPEGLFNASLTMTMK